jgi:DNA repair protein RecO (recombination protein O)
MAQVHYTNGIVLHRFKYSDSKVIAKVFTEDFGLQSYMFFGAGSKKGRTQINLLQPFTPLSMQVYHKETSEMQKTKEVSLLFPVMNLTNDVIKSSLALFLSEFILKVIKESETDKDLFSFFMESVRSLNAVEEGVGNFHLIFLIRFTKFLGILPQNNYSESHGIFDMRSANFMIGRPTHEFFLNEELSRLLSVLHRKDLEDIPKSGINHHQRKLLLDGLIRYYNLHLDRPGKLKSLKVLTELFS